MICIVVDPFHNIVNKLLDLPGFVSRLNDPNLPPMQAHNTACGSFSPSHAACTTHSPLEKHVLLTSRSSFLFFILPRNTNSTPLFFLSTLMQFSAVKLLAFQTQHRSHIQLTVSTWWTLASLMVKSLRNCYEQKECCAEVSSQRDRLSRELLWPTSCTVSCLQSKSPIRVSLTRRLCPILRFSFTLYCLSPTARCQANDDLKCACDCDCDSFKQREKTKELIKSPATLQLASDKETGKAE